MDLRVFSAISILFALSYAAAEEHYFYTGTTSGSLGFYHPVNVLLNGGYDIFQTGSIENKPFEIDYATSADNLLENLSHPLRQIDRYGWERFIGSEIVPTSLETSGSQYIPNYLLHVIGGGTTYRTLLEWYDYRKYPMPVLWAVGTSTLYHALNELVENNGYTGVNVDPIADIYLFDPLGILLFSWDGAARFMAEYLHAADWSGMPMYSPLDSRLENASQNYVLKWVIPKQHYVGAFTYFGMNSLLGLSLFVKDYCISGGMGLSTRKIEEVVDHSVAEVSDGRTMTIKTIWSSGIFIDREKSLLMSLIISGERGYRVMLNAYPGAVPRWGKAMPGIFLGLGKNYEFIAGLTTRGFPLGLSARTRPKG